MILLFAYSFFLLVYEESMGRFSQTYSGKHDCNAHSMLTDTFRIANPIGGGLYLTHELNLYMHTFVFRNP